MAGLQVELDRLDRTRRALDEVADALDRLGHRLPTGGELGAAAALVAAALAVGTGSAALVGVESRVLGAAVGAFREDMTHADAVAVTDLFRVGG